MKKIKFRGKDIKSNNYVYGFFIMSGDDCVIVTAEGLKTIVHPDVAQFIGYDMNDEEVYDDDTLISYYEEISVKATEALSKWDFGDTFKDYVLWK